jgi:NADH:ubiquinone oxidoreductase subunit 6 (subunit J)
VSDFVFWPLAAVLVVSALGVVLSHNLFRAVFWLAATLVTTAVFYLALSSALLAAVQILLYTGGVLTLVIFALVVTAQTDDPTPWRRPLPALILSALVFAVLVRFLGGLDPAQPVAGLDDGQTIGADLFTRYIVPFELLSVLLLGAIFGALAIARKEGAP